MGVILTTYPKILWLQNSKILSRLTFRFENLLGWLGHVVFTDEISIRPCCFLVEIIQTHRVRKGVLSYDEDLKKNHRLFGFFFWGVSLLPR